MSDAPNTVAAEAKRIPGPVWIGILAAGGLLGLYLRSRMNKAGPVSIGDAAAGTPVQAPAPLVGETVVTPIYQTPVAQPGAAKPASNLEWINQALELAIAQGADPGSASSGIHKYAVSGDPLTTEEAAIVKRAVRVLGEPPEGIPPPQFPTNPIPSSPPPVRTPTPTFPYTTGPGDTFAAVANAIALWSRNGGFAGLPPGAVHPSTQSLRDQNPGVSDPIPPGTVINVPFA